MRTKFVPLPSQSTFSRKLVFVGEVTDDQKKRLLVVTNACPVHKVLSSHIEFKTEIKE